MYSLTVGKQWSSVDVAGILEIVGTASEAVSGTGKRSWKDYRTACKAGALPLSYVPTPSDYTRQTRDFRGNPLIGRFPSELLYSHSEGINLPGGMLEDSGRKQTNWVRQRRDRCEELEI